MRPVMFRILAGSIGIISMLCLLFSRPAAIVGQFSMLLFGIAFILYAILGEHWLVYPILTHGRIEPKGREYRLDSADSELRDKDDAMDTNESGESSSER